MKPSVCIVCRWHCVKSMICTKDKVCMMKTSPFIKTKEQISCWWHCYYVVSLQISGGGVQFRWWIVNRILPHCFNCVQQKMARLDCCCFCCCTHTKNRHKNRWLSVNRNTGTQAHSFYVRMAYLIPHEDRKYHARGHLLCDIQRNMWFTWNVSPDFMSPLSHFWN